jgi:hypothetical protein
MSSTLNPDEEPLHAPDDGEPRGHDTGSLGPGDSSDSGSDVAGAKRHDFDRDGELDEHALETGDAELASDTDRHGTGERASADGDGTLELDEDIEPDRTDAPQSDADAHGER